jgi:hypothetical protein
MRPLFKSELILVAGGNNSEIIVIGNPTEEPTGGTTFTTGTTTTTTTTTTDSSATTAPPPPPCLHELNKGRDLSVDRKNNSLADNIKVERTADGGVKITIDVTFSTGADPDTAGSQAISEEMARTYIAAIEKAWTQSFQNNGHTISVDVNASYVSTGGDVILTDCPSCDQKNRDGAAQLGGRYLFVDTTEFKDHVKTNDLDEIAGHEFGHILGFDHEKSALNELMSNVDANPSMRVTINEIIALAEKYGEKEGEACPHG